MQFFFKTQSLHLRKTTQKIACTHFPIRNDLLNQKSDHLNHSNEDKYCNE